jgi:radical SAM protein with 4Fe4S-binding SPASM domain
MWYSPTPLCLFNTVTEGLGNKGCAACDGLVSVDPQGNILPCSSWNEPVGNLLTQSFAEIWNSPRAVFIRNKKETPAVCSSCDSFALCQGACPLFFKHNFCNDESLLKPRITTTHKTTAI